MPRWRRGAGHRVAQPHRATPSWTYGAVQPVSPLGGAGQDGDHPRPGVGRQVRSRNRQRLHRGRAHQDRPGMGNLRQAVRALGRDVGDLDSGLRRTNESTSRASITPCATCRSSRDPSSGPARPSPSEASARSTRCRLVARYADVWNVPTYALGELERKVSVLRIHLRGHRTRSRHHRVVGRSRHGSCTR